MTKLKQRIMAQRGQVYEKRPDGKLRLVDAEDASSVYRTARMILVEMRLRQPIEEILSQPKSSRKLAKELGISPSCVLKWRRKMHIDGQS